MSLPTADSPTTDTRSSSVRPLRLAEAEATSREAVESGVLERSRAEALGYTLRDDRMVLEAVCEAAAEAKRRAFGDVVTVSPNVFIPLTNLCRNRCTYCTFVKHPNDPAAKFFDDCFNVS